MFTSRQNSKLSTIVFETGSSAGSLFSGAKCESSTGDHFATTSWVKVPLGTMTSWPVTLKGHFTCAGGSFFQSRFWSNDMRNG